MEALESCAVHHANTRVKAFNLNFHLFLQSSTKNIELTNMQYRYI